MNISKIKYFKEKVMIDYENNGDEFSLISKQTPLKSLSSALSAFQKYTADLLNVKAGFTIKGIHFKEGNEDVEHRIRVVGSYPVKDGKVFNFVTPLDESYDNETAKNIELLIEETKRFVNGERLQTNMNFKKNPKKSKK
ncbi:MAG: hypothetical protein OEM46_00650 [Ignavibacteria bacterium]|nr:hypothetical protein [Ignavibacteria bacterium]